MNVRDHNVLIVCADAGQMPLTELAQVFFDAAMEADTEGLASEHDPAVVLLAAFISFRTNTDSIPYSSYAGLLERVQERMNEMPEVH